MNDFNRVMKRKRGFRFIPLVICVLVAYLNDNCLGDTGVLILKKDIDVNWQWLTMYKIGSGSGWSRQGNTGRYVVCDIPTTLTNHTNSWLISDFIQSDGVNELVTSLIFTTRQCPHNYPYCVQYFNVFALFNDNELPGGVSLNAIMEGNLSFVGNVTAGVTWNTRVPPQDNIVNVTIVLPKKGLYLAIQDIGTCVALKEVSVTYKYCPMVTSNGVTYNQTFSPASRDGERNVTGKCLDNATPYLRNSSLLGKCLANGDWKINNVVCLCNLGHEMLLGTCRVCPSGTYKSIHGNQACKTCASHTHSAMTHDKCECDTGYYRAAYDPVNSSCTAPPSAPIDLRTTVRSQDVVMMIWLPPIDNGGRDDVTYDVICRQCITGVCDVMCNDVSFWPANQSLSRTYVTISGAIPKVSYRITVLAKNGVSGIAGLSYHGNASVILTIPEYTTAEFLTNGTRQYGANSASRVEVAIGVSVACTFIFCLLVGLIIAAYFIHKHKQKSRVHCSGNEISNNYKQQRKESHTTNETELQSIPQDGNLNSLSSDFDLRDKNIVGTPEGNKTKDFSEIKAEKGFANPAFCRTSSNDALCEDTSEGPLVLQLPPSEFQNEVSKMRSSVKTVKSWFPQENIQYDI